MSALADAFYGVSVAVQLDAARSLMRREIAAVFDAQPGAADDDQRRADVRFDRDYDGGAW